MNKSELKAIFINAKATDAKYIGVSIQTEGSSQPEIIINPNPNFDAKFDYYMEEYDDDLILIAAKGKKDIRITAAGQGNRFEDIECQLLGERGNGYVYMRKKFDRKKFGGEIKIVDLWVMQSNCVQIVVDDAGIFAGVGRLWYVYTDPTSGRQYVFSTDEVMHFKTSFSFDGITGLPVQQILRDTVAGASESQAFMNNLYESGLTAKATLEYTGELNEKAKEALVKSFEEFGSGAKNTGKILPVPLGMKLTPLDIKLTDSQFFELKKYNALQIAGAFGVKPNQINDYSKSSYSNSEMQQLSFYVDTELFIIEQYEEEINFKMLPDEDTDDGYYYKFNEKVLFRTDSKTQMEYLRNGVGGMIIKPNEARRKLDMEDAEGGDVLLANGSIVPLTMAGAAYLKGESEQENTDEPEQPEEETEPDTEQPDTATEPDETDTAEDETDEEGGE